MDFAGVVKVVGSKVTDLKSGDEVYGFSKVIINNITNAYRISITREVWQKLLWQMLTK